MRKIFFNSIFAFLLAVSFTSCELFEIDNYDEPKETLKGSIVDVTTGEPVLTDQGQTGSVRIRLQELSWTQTEEAGYFDFACFQDGTFQNTKVFKGTYNIRVDGPFIPLVRVNNAGEKLFDGTQTVEIRGVTTVKFEVQPFLKVEITGTPAVSVNPSGQTVITAQIKVTRAISPEDFRAIIEPLGGYNANFTDVTDINLYVSEVPYPGPAEYDSNYSVIQIGNYNNQLGETLTITTLKDLKNKGQSNEIKGSRPIFIRAAARINYTTEGTRRFNLSPVVKVNVP
jgi:hypothetical protein